MHGVTKYHKQKIGFSSLLEPAHQETKRCRLACKQMRTACDNIPNPLRITDRITLAANVPPPAINFITSHIIAAQLMFWPSRPFSANTNTITIIFKARLGYSKYNSTCETLPQYRRQLTADTHATVYTHARYQTL